MTLNLTLFIRIRTQLVVISAMVTPEANPETSAAGAQLVHREELQDLVQSLVQQALADGELCQPPAAGDSGERLGGGAAWYED